MKEPGNRDQNIHALAQAAESKDPAKLVDAYKNVANLKVEDFIAYILDKKTRSSEGNNILKAMRALEEFRDFGKEMSQVLGENRSLRSAFLEKMFSVNNPRVQVAVGYNLLLEMKGLSPAFKDRVSANREYQLKMLPTWDEYPESKKLQEEDIAKASLVQKIPSSAQAEPAVQPTAQPRIGMRRGANRG